MSEDKNTNKVLIRTKDGWVEGEVFVKTSDGWVSDNTVLTRVLAGWTESSNK